MSLPVVRAGAGLRLLRAAVFTAVCVVLSAAGHALGSYATVYFNDLRQIDDATRRIADLPGIEGVYTREQGCRAFELPPDRVGDLIVVSERLTVIGTSRDRHDLSGLDAPLRSHGGLSEQAVPLLVNRRTRAPGPGGRLRNFDVFDVVLNGVAS